MRDSLKTSRQLLYVHELIHASQGNVLQFEIIYFIVVGVHL